MRVHRFLIIAKMLMHRNFSIRLLDEIGTNRGSFEISEHAYLDMYNQHIVAEGDEKAIEWLGFDTMLENGIFVYNNKRNSTVVIPSFIVETLRFVDVGRARELSNADFENFRVILKSLHDAIVNAAIDSDDYKEAMVSLFELLSGEVLSKISHNVEILDAHKNALGELINTRTMGQESALTSEEIYKKIIHIYERFVVPFQDFMNPVKMMKGKGVYNFWEMLDGLIRHHSKIGKQDVATELGYLKISLTSFYKDTKRIVDDFRVYYEFMEKDRKSYLAIQSAYGALLGDLEELRHGKLINKFLPDDAAIMQHGEVFKGISNLRAVHAQKINWNQYTQLQFNEWKRVAGEGGRRSSSADLKPVPKDIDISKERRKQISSMVFKKHIPDSVRDIHGFLHEWLSNELQDYTMLDLLRAFEIVKSLKKSKIFCHRTKARVDDGKFYLDYLIRSI